MKVERILRVTATVKTVISGEAYKKVEAKADGSLEAIVIKQLHDCLWACNRALLDEIIEDPSVSYRVLHMEYDRDNWRLLSTIVVEKPLAIGGAV